MTGRTTSILFAVGALSLAGFAAVPVDPARLAVDYAAVAPAGAPACPDIAARVAHGADAIMPDIGWYDGMSTVSVAGGTPASSIKPTRGCAAGL